jgi:hypothetical protein
MIEFYRIDTYINENGNIIWSLIINLLGTLLGFAGAFWIALEIYRKQVKKEELKQLNRYKDRLSFIIDLIKSSIKTVNAQLENFENLGNTINNDLLNYHELGIVASNDMERIQKMDTAEVFYAYNYLVPESPEKANDYQKIFSCIDFLYLRIKQGISSADKQVMFVHRDQMSVKKIVDDLANKIYALIKHYENNVPIFKKLKEYEFLVNSHKTYVRLSEEKAPLQSIEEEFVVIFGGELYRDYEKTFFFSELYFYAQNAQITLNHIKDNSLKFANEMFKIKTDCKDKIDFLEIINKKLIKE